MTAEPVIYGEVIFMPPLETEGRHRRQLTRVAEDVIRMTLYP